MGTDKLTQKTQLHYVLRDANSSIIENIHDIAVFDLTDRQLSRTSPIFLDVIDECKNDKEILSAAVSYCFSNPIFAARWLLGMDLMPFQGAVLESLWNHRFTYFLGSRGASKSLLFAIYSLLKAILIPGSKIVLVSNTFRQSKIIFNYILQVYESWPILRQLTSKNEYPKFHADACRFKIGTSNITALPMGQGDGIRGERSNCTIIDEFQEINEEIFQVVIMGFSAVSMSPNEKVRRLARQKSTWIGYNQEEKQGVVDLGNQIILGGTASFEFNHAFKWYNNYLDIIRTRGDKEAIRKYTNGQLTQEELESFSWKDFAVITLPHDKLPHGFLDEQIVTNAKLQNSEEFYSMEYLCRWISDTKGFIPMSLIKSHIEGEIKNSSVKPCVMGVDPARSSANFAIVISEINEDGEILKPIYCWSFNEKRLNKEFNIGHLPNIGFYALAALKILYLTYKFNIKMIVMDKGGGGPAVADVLKSPSIHSLPSEYCIHPIVDIDDPDIIANSKRILHIHNFTNEDIKTYNFMWKKDIESNKYIFSEQNEDGMVINYDSNDFLEDNYEFLNDEIVAMQREISIVKPIQNITGTVRFDTGTGGSRPKKDRYSAALMSYLAFKYMEDFSTKNEIKEEFYDTCANLIKR